MVKKLVLKSEPFFLEILEHVGKIHMLEQEIPGTNIYTPLVSKRGVGATFDTPAPLHGSLVV